MGDQAMFTMNDLGRLIEAYGTTIENNQQVLTGLTGALQSLADSNSARDHRRMPGAGPKPKEPKPYDGDRTNNKLDDHVRDLEHWVDFYAKRNHWADEADKIKNASTYLEGRIHRLFTLKSESIQTFTDYVKWLRTTFRDNNEKMHLREEWRGCVQGRKKVQSYAADLLYIAERMNPPKSKEEIREHFRTGLNAEIQARLIENPECENYALEEFIAQADRAESVLDAKDHFWKQTSTKAHGQAFAIRDVDPRRGPVGSQASVAPRKDDPTWKSWCVEHHACFTCGKPGHGARDCSQKKRDPPLSPVKGRQGRRRPVKGGNPRPQRLGKARAQ